MALLTSNAGNMPPGSMNTKSNNNQGFYQIVCQLGEGAFGTVKLVVDSSNQSCALAMKCIPTKGKADTVISQLRKECLLQRKLSQQGHDNVIRYIGYRADPDEYLIFLEYADGGELFDQIVPDVGLSENRAQMFFRQLLDGVEYIHSHGIVHRDIKPENLLLTRSDQLKISDFGMATIFEHGGKKRELNSPCGTPVYAAPEVFRAGRQCYYQAEPVDIWSSGVVLAVMLSGEHIWQEPTAKDPSYICWASGEGLDRNPFKKFSTTALSLLRIILQEDVCKRATADRIRKHPWFNTNFGVSHSEPPMKRGRYNPHKNDSGFADCASQPTTSKMTSVENEFAKIFTRSENFQAIESFTQPADIDSLLLSKSQFSDVTQGSKDPLMGLVCRMTRLCVTIEGEPLLDRVHTACDQHGFVSRTRSTSQMIITYRDTIFMMTVYSMLDNGARKTMLDFRRSRGDGLEFKKAFLTLRDALADITCPRGDEWLEQKGLAPSQRIEFGVSEIIPTDNKFRRATEV